MFKVENGYLKELASAVYGKDVNIIGVSEDGYNIHLSGSYISANDFMADVKLFTWKNKACAIDSGLDAKTFHDDPQGYAILRNNGEERFEGRWEWEAVCFAADSLMKPIFSLEEQSVLSLLPPPPHKMG